ncbi:MAG: hypothetical protein ACJAS9_002514 [Polaribacter sp.]|jgi:hypothetical protein
MVLITVSIAGTLSVLNSGKVNAATFTGGLSQIFLQKHISPQLRNAASALWLGNYSYYISVSPFPERAIFQVITGNGVTSNGEPLSRYRIPLQDWYTEPAAWFLMEKYQQVHTGGNRDIKPKIVGFSLHKLESEFPSMYGFMVGLNWFTNTYLFDGSKRPKRAEEFLVKSIFQSAYDTKAIAAKQADSYLNNSNIEHRTKLIIEAKDKLMAMKDRQRPYIALCSASVLELLYLQQERIWEGPNTYNINNNLEVPLRDIRLGIRVRGPPTIYKEGVM